MKAISMIALMALICHFTQAQNLDAALKAYYIQCDKIFAIECPNLMQKRLQELKDSLGNENSGNIENKYEIDFWFEDGYDMPIINKTIEPILRKYDKMEEQLRIVHTKMYDEFSQPVPPDSKDKFFMQRLKMKTIKSYIDNKDGKLRMIFETYRKTAMNELLPYAKKIAKDDKQAAIMICQYICDRYRQVVELILDEYLQYQVCEEDIRLNRVFEGWK